MDVNEPNRRRSTSIEDLWDWIEPAVKLKRGTSFPWPLIVGPDLSRWEIHERFRTFTVAQWNSTVQLLDGGSGYPLVCGLLDRLTELHRAAEVDAERWDARFEVVRRLAFVLEHEVEAHGADALVGHDLERDNERQWHWVPVDPLDLPPSVGTGGDGATTYRLADPTLDVPFSVDPDLATLSSLYVSSANTWGHHQRGLESAGFGSRLHQRSYELSARKEALAARAQLVGAVLEEFEMLGFAKELGEDEALSLDLEGHVERFIAEALGAIEILDDDSRRPKGKRKSFNAVADVLGGGDSLGWSKDSIETFIKQELNDLLPGPPLFEKWKGAGSGPGARASQRGRYRTFRSGIITIAKAAGMDVSHLEELNRADRAQ